MKRKFSLANIPLLNIGPARLDAKTLREQLLSPSESRPPTPRSVRPPLPNDVDAELRAACTYIVTHPKPSHHVWATDAPKPALDYAAVKHDAEHLIAAPAKKPSVRSRGVALGSDAVGETSKYSYRPNVATEDLFRPDEQERAPTHAQARSRADQLMVSEPVKLVSISPRVQVQQPAQPDSQQLAPLVRSDVSEKKRRSTRSNSAGTTGSTPHTDTTDYPWSASTAMTSAAITPARDSKRTSSQNVAGHSEAGSVPKVEAVNGEWMRKELEKHKRAMEERGRESVRETDFPRQTVDTAPVQVTAQVPMPAARVPPRKPVPSRPGTRQADETPQPESRQGRPKPNRDQPPLSNRGGSESSRHATERIDSSTDRNQRGRGITRLSSRLGRAASRTASRAESITNEIIGHYSNPDSARDAQRPGSAAGPRRSSSRARSISNHIKDYIRPSRPGTSMASRQPSMDAGRGHARKGSMDSLQSSASKATNSGTRSRLRDWHPFRKGRSQVATPDTSRPGSSGSAIRGRNGLSEQRDSPPKSKPPIDLNRELPPLPGLDQWKAEDETPAQQQSHPIPQSDSTPAQFSGLRRILSRRHKELFSQAPQGLSRENHVAARLGSPTPPRSQKQSVDGQRFEPGYPSPPVSLSPDIRSPDLGLQQLSANHSREPLSHAVQRSDQRWRSGSSQSSQPELTIDRTTSTSATSANLYMLPVPRSATATPVTGKRRADMRGGYKSSSASVNVAHAHARTNSDSSNAVGNQYVDEYTRQDARYPHAVAMPQQPVRDKEESRRKWWQSKDKRQHADWMNQVSRSGARNGVLVPEDEAAGSPVVRF